MDDRRPPGMSARLFALTFLLALCSALGARAQSPQSTSMPIDFEQFPGPSVFTGVQAPLTIGEATFSGGQVLSAATFLPADPTNVYGTAYFCPGCLPTITIDFSKPVSNFRMLVLNGQTFTVRPSASSTRPRRRPRAWMRSPRRAPARSASL